jgi:SAM-dependent methyltransferase
VADLAVSGALDAMVEQALARRWYHTIQLPDGRVTNGWFDLRPYVGEYGLPKRMDGMRALDVGTWDGFWAFEMERRGATVVALDLDDERDLDWPPRRRPGHFPEEPRGEGFRLAKAILRSGVERATCSIYDALPDVLGQFDLVFCGSVLMHLRDQLLALERMAALARDDGVLVAAEEYDRLANLVPFPVSRYRADRESAVVFWLPSVRTWKRMAWTAGFDRVEEHGRFALKVNSGFTVRHVVLHAYR